MISSTHSTAGAKHSSDIQTNEACVALIRLLGSSKLLVVIMNIDAEIIYSNDHFCQVTGWSRHQLEGRFWQDVLAPPGIGNLRPLFDDLLIGNSGSWHQENEILTKSGESLFIRWNNLLIRDSLGVVLGAACIGENVTERVLLERMLTTETGEVLRALQCELHDGLGQELFGISMTAKSLATVVARGGVASQLELDCLSRAANAAMDACRLIARNIVLVSNVSGDLLGALRKLMEQSTPPLGPRLTYSETTLNKVSLSAAAADHIFKIAREALTNALKHSQAKNISLRVNVRSKRIIVELSDDGIGFDPSRIGRGIGLKLMQHRAGLLHAVLQIQNRAEGGLMVRLRCTVASNAF